MTRAIGDHRSSYVHFHSITTRWLDNDAYGHVNNILYYSWFDTVVNQLLISNAVLDIEHSPVIGLVIASHCDYFSPVAFPQQITAGLRVAHLGQSSVRYEIAIFCEDAPIASAQGYLVHVYVDRATRRPAAVPPAMRALLEKIRVPTTSSIASQP